MSKSLIKRTLLIIFLVLMGYSFLPLIRFWIMPDPVKTVKNAEAVKQLGENKGSYFSFIVFGDNHAGLWFNDAAALKEIWHINREDRFLKVPIDFVLNTGDVSLNGKRKHFENYRKIVDLIKFPVVSAIGNHDDRALFEEFIGDKEFAFADRNSYFIVLDNEEGQLTEEQFFWLEERLKEGKGYAHIFVTLHKPPFDPYQQEWYNMDNSPWAYKFRKLCGEYGVDMIFSGHKHMFKEEGFDGVKYVVTGGGGMLTEIPDADGGFLHYIRVMVNNDYVTYEIRKISPPLWEYVTYYFWKEAVYFVRNFYGTGYIFGGNKTVKGIRAKDVNEREYWL
ncbi:MAG: metallophosphoesterase [Candidatus Omnitrophota bacterium]|nr:metallophosphoesterase [Candidatus Omnitrophota bacterium]